VILENSQTHQEIINVNYALQVIIQHQQVVLTAKYATKDDSLLQLEAQIVNFVVLGNSKIHKAVQHVKYAAKDDSLLQLEA